MLIVIGICLFKHLSLLISVTQQWKVKITQLNGFYQAFFWGKTHIHFDIKMVLMPDSF